MFKLYLYNEKVYFQPLLKKRKKEKKKVYFQPKKMEHGISVGNKNICNRSTRVESYMMPDLEEKADLIDFS